MTTEKMTVHKALAELKIIDDRIYKAIHYGTFVYSCKNNSDKINGVSASDFKKAIESNYQKAKDLINRRNAMKRAVVLSNATTKVTIGDKEYTVAEAIEMKNHGMDGKKDLLQHMTVQYNDAVRKFNLNSGENLEERANQYVANILGTTDKNVEQVTVLHDAYIKNNGFEMVDPLDISAKIDEIDKEIDEFNAEVDSALSVSNALTVIEFEY